MKNLYRLDILIVFILVLCILFSSCTDTDNPPGTDTTASPDEHLSTTGPSENMTTSPEETTKEPEKEIDVPLDQIPDFKHGTYKDTYPCGNGSEQRYYIDADPAQIDLYVNTLDELGYKKKEDKTVGENRYVTCLGKNGLVHITYLAYNNSLSVLTDPLAETVYKDSEPEYEKVAECTLAVMSLDFSHREILDANGLSYIITLEDGRYVVFDGGYKNSTDANILYNYMKDNNKRADGKVMIAAWVFTHPHDDHYGSFEAFTVKYASKVGIEYFIYNSGDGSMYTKNPNSFFDGTLKNNIKIYYPDAKIIKPHTGQTITFCNTEFEVMYTQENYAPNILPSVNDASLVLRMRANGVTVLFTGDCERDSSNLISKMYKNEIHSDILQINHHGYSGGTIELYRYTDPSYSIWPTSQAAFEKRVTGVKYQWIGNALESNKYIYDKVGEANCFVADGDIEMITFVGGDKKIEVGYHTPDQSTRLK